MIAQGMSAFGQDASSRLEAKPASPVGNADAPTPCPDLTLSMRSTLIDRDDLQARWNRSSKAYYEREICNG